MRRAPTQPPQGGGRYLSGIAPSYDLEEVVFAPVAPAVEKLRDAFFESIGRLTFGLVQARRWSFWVGPLLMLEFGDPRPHGHGWRWPIRRGLLTRAAAGEFGFEWRDGRLLGNVNEYRPAMPEPAYGLLQLPVHRHVTRLFLLWVRGRAPAPGVPAEPALRLAAGAADLLLCALIARRRGLPALLALTAAYHAGLWAIGGRTPGAYLFGQRVVAVDGTRAAPGQALLRLATVPLALYRRRALHDELAGTEVIKVR
jgi:hypothetical protein